MANTIDWRGKSGKTYRYFIHPRHDTTFNAVAGNYIFSREVTPGRWKPIYIGETADLSSRFLNHHQNDCIDKNGATHVHVHTSGGLQERLDEETDLRHYWDSACNQQ